MADSVHPMKIYLYFTNWSITLEFTDWHCCPHEVSVFCRIQSFMGTFVRLPSIDFFSAPNGVQGSAIESNLGQRFQMPPGCLNSSRKQTIFPYSHIRLVPSLLRSPDNIQTHKFRHRLLSAKTKK